MHDLTVRITVLLWTVATVWYVRLVLRNEIRPGLAPWIIMSTTMLLGLSSFLMSSHPTVGSGIGFIAGIVSTYSVFFTVVYVTIREKREVAFNRFQKNCLWAAGAIAVVWVVLRVIVGGETAAAATNFLTQLLMTIGYIALLERLWTGEGKSESLGFWCLMLLGCLFSIIVPIRERNWLGIVYGGRSILTSGITVALILRTEAKMRKATLADASLR